MSIYVHTCMCVRESEIAQPTANEVFCNALYMWLQVEVEMGEFVPDFSNSVLVHRSAIEELNSQIKVWGGTLFRILVSLVPRLWPGNEACHHCADSLYTGPWRG